MRLYVILNRRTKHEYAITNKLWLARLYYMQRFSVNGELIFISRKSKQSKSTIIYSGNWLHYFSGYVMSNDELRYINSVLDDAGVGYLRQKYRKPKFKKIINDVEDDLIKRSIHKCIYQNSEVIDRLNLLTEWEERMR